MAVSQILDHDFAAMLHALTAIEPIPASILDALVDLITIYS
jgi:hypothetical protein